MTCRQGICWEEPLLFEKHRPGGQGYSLPSTGVTEQVLDDLIPPRLRRGTIAGMPQLSEPDVVRHFNRLASWNYPIDRGLYPLGSCTMKYNPRLNEEVARLPGFLDLHPYLPEEWVQGALGLLWDLERAIQAVTGMDAVTLQPAAGAHGELTGLLLIRKFFQDRGERRTTVLVPDSAHGTNPASAAFCGHKVVQLPSDKGGCLSPETLQKAMTEEVAALMITNPNTLGFFEEDIDRLCHIVHHGGGLVYLDGANLNAVVGISRPREWRIDVLHINLHKTFGTPHGGGGPGSGPVCVRAFLEPYLPTPRILRKEDRFVLDEDLPKSIGRVKGFYGHFGVAVRALAYLLSYGHDHLKDIAVHAVVNANYLRARLKETYHQPYDRPVMHEVVLSDRNQQPCGITTQNIAKRLMDYGFHPPTVYFPLVVPGALMIEPTETENRKELDRFADALLAIAAEAEADPEALRRAPTETFLRRLDEVAAARRPVLRWTPDTPQEPETTA